MTIHRTIHRKGDSIEIVSYFNEVFTRKQTVTNGIATIQWIHSKGKTITSKMYSDLEMNYIQCRLKEVALFQGSPVKVDRDFYDDGCVINDCIEMWQEMQKEKRSERKNEKVNENDE